MQNIVELRNSLADNYVKLKAGKMNIALGKELANTAGKIINSCKAQLDYNQMIGSKGTIDFLESVPTLNKNN